jgi:hypothetical protein
MSTEVPSTLVGALVVAVTVLAGVVVVLFKLYIGRNATAEKAISDKDKEMADERKGWAVRITQHEGELAKLRLVADAELESLRADCEKRMREHADSYATELQEARDMHLGREDAIRKDCLDRIERIEKQASDAAQAQNVVLNKIYERFVGPRRGVTR